MGHGMYPKDQQRRLAGGRHLGSHQKTGACESARRLGKMQLLQPGPVCTCPEEEGGGRPSHNAERPASGQPGTEGKEVCLGIRTVRFREGGSRKEQAGGKMVGLEP